MHHATCFKILVSKLFQNFVSKFVSKFHVSKSAKMFQNYTFAEVNCCFCLENCIRMLSNYALQSQRYFFTLEVWFCEWWWKKLGLRYVRSFFTMICFEVVEERPAMVNESCLHCEQCNQFRLIIKAASFLPWKFRIRLNISISERSEQLVL